MAMNLGPSPDIRSLTIGHDIHELGLDMRQSESLHSTYMGPFASNNGPPPRPLDSEYHLPSCYTVQNVVPLQQRINGFTEETLFYIFYSSPRDIMQEWVAEELMTRKWRFHMREKMWVTRDETAQAPVEVEQGVSESGVYIWWDWQNWKKIRRQYVLRYEDLDDHLSGGMRMGVSNAALGSNTAGLVGTGGGAAGGGFNAVPGLERLAAGMGRGF